jgi:arylsulfatase A-like enzyme
MRHPSVIPAGRRIEQQVRLIDVMPTVLAALEIPIPPGTVGHSLLPLAQGSGADRPVLGGFLSNTEQAVVIRHHRMKYVYSPNRTALRQKIKLETEELYDLEADPEERENLVMSGHPRLEYFRNKAKRWIAGPRPPMQAEVHFDDATTAKLRALGYLAPAPANGPAPGAAPKPGTAPAPAPAAAATPTPAAASAATAPPAAPPARAQ